MKLVQRKEPVIVFRKEDLTLCRAWQSASMVHGIREYIILYDNEEHIYINPASDNSQRIFEITNKLFKQKYINSRGERLLDEIIELAGKETEKYLYMVWIKWRDKVKHMELNAQAGDIIKRMRSERLYCKAKKNSKIIMELFNIGFGLYDDTATNDFQKGADNAFMYGYLLGMEETIKKGMSC